MARSVAYLVKLYGLSNRYLITRDYLDASMMRIKGGFTPFSELSSAQRHVDEIAEIFAEMKKVIREKDDTDTTSFKFTGERRDCCS